MATKNSLMTVLSRSPWWASVVFAAFVYLLMSVVAPMLLSTNPRLSAIGVGLSKVAWISAVFLFPGFISVASSVRKRALFDSQSEEWSPERLSWQEFENLLSEAFRRQGYNVRDLGGDGPDGGIDLEIHKGRERYLVQCKHWKIRRVGVKVVREMFGVMTAEKATGVYIVTSGQFTPDAILFAEGKPIQLVDGVRLKTMISSSDMRPSS
jgi:restriction system protein